jgi:hypothetical protein
MGRSKQQSNAMQTVMEPSSLVLSTFEPSPARVTLPGDLAGSLKYLDDAQLQRLREAVTVEINRRNQGTSKNKTATAAATGTSSEPAPLRDKRLSGVDEIPEGKANLIRASFSAGVKPAAIARTLRISRSLVSRILSSAAKPKQ